MDQVAKQSTIDRIAQANNVLVTVSANPSVDQLAAALGLTLFLNKNGKHATAVFSGDVPSTLEFLQPEKTIEKNTDSLRDFIIALDKAKADKLRYKVEDKVVKIFITPYRTSISEKDFDFSQGDFNVDVIIALGVHTKEELDHAIIAHGRILHDATVISINNTTSGSLGTINWQDQQASSLCEMLVEMAEVIKADSFDAQMATAFLTGIVAETQRFSNEKTTSRTMSFSAKLMAAGANQQLVATQLQSKSSIAKAKGSDSDEDEPSEDGTLEIDHEAKEPEVTLPKPKADEAEAPAETPLSEPASPIGDVRSEDQGTTPSDLITSIPTPAAPAVNPAFPAQAPSRGGTLTANTKPEDLSPAVDPLAPTKDQPLMERGKPGTAADNNLGQKTISNIEDAVIDQDKTLTDIEKTVDSPHAPVEPTPLPSLTPTAPVEPAPALAPQSPLPANPADGLDSARDAVAAAASESTPRLEPRASVGASMPLEINNAPAAPLTPVNSSIPADPGLPPEQTAAPAAPAPPPVPPPMTMPFGGSTSPTS